MSGNGIERKDLVGVWTLVSYREVLDDGSYAEGPLGPNPRGLLIYTDDGHVAVNMMRTAGSATEPGAHDYMGYAGTWRFTGAQAVHTIKITPTTAWVDTEQLRDVELNCGLLTLQGTALVGGEKRRRVLHWLRSTTGKREP